MKKLTYHQRMEIVNSLSVFIREIQTGKLTDEEIFSVISGQEPVGWVLCSLADRLLAPLDEDAREAGLTLITADSESHLREPKENDATEP